MREIEVSRLTEVIEKLCIEANEHLPEDVKDAIKTCRACEDGEIAKGVLDNIIENFDIADSENVRQPESRSDEKGYVCRIQNEADGSVKYDGIFSGNVYGTYVHGIFDEGTLAETLVGILAERKGVVLDTGQMISYGQFKQMQYDKLADGLRESMDMEAVYAMLREAAI